MPSTMDICCSERHIQGKRLIRRFVRNICFSVMWCIMIGGCATSTGPLATLPLSSPIASQHNLSGITEYHKGHWELAKQHFEAAVQADQNLSEAHFNFALSLHKLNIHEQATTHFQRAGELDPNNKDITESSLYRNHLGISTTLERHITGGYRY